MTLVVEHDQHAVRRSLVAAGAAERLDPRGSARDASRARVGIDDWQPLVRVDEALVRPADPTDQRGDARRAREVLGWSPTVGFAEIVGRMVDADVAAVDREDGEGEEGP